MLRYIPLFLFAAAACVHLYHSWTDESKKRAYTKPLLLIFLILYYVLSASPLSWVLLFALITSWLGDVLLIPKGNGWFTAGGIAFLCSHILFILVYAPSVSFHKTTLLAAIPAALVYLGIALAVILAVRKETPKIMVVPMYLYLIANSTMNVFALMQLISRPGAGAAVAYAGAVLFFASDCTLYLVRYHKNKQLIFKRHFTVMLTYLLGEFLITQGMLMLTGIK